MKILTRFLYFVLIYLGYNVGVFGDNVQVSIFKDNNDNVRIIKLRDVKINIFNRTHFVTLLEAEKTPLYELGGKDFTKTLVINQWEFKDQALFGGDQVSHRFTVLNDSEIYIEQTMLYHPNPQCRIFNMHSQILFKPKGCFYGDFSNYEYQKIHKRLFAIWSSGEGVGAFALVDYTSETGQTILYEVGLSYAVVGNVNYRNGAVYFSSDCDLRKPCLLSTKLLDKELHFKWGKIAGLVTLDE